MMASARHNRRRTILFGLGDCLFLMLAAASATLAMQVIHRLGWSMPITWVIGMAAAMAVQMLLALIAAPLLGSIETMVPSMIIAMVSPMAVCLLEAIGHGIGWRLLVVLGDVAGFLMFVLMRAYGCSCRRRLSREFAR